VGHAFQALTSNNANLVTTQSIPSRNRAGRGEIDIQPWGMDPGVIGHFERISRSMETAVC